MSDSAASAPLIWKNAPILRRRFRFETVGSIFLSLFSILEAIKRILEVKHYSQELDRSISVSH